MKELTINVGDKVRHRHLMLGTDLSVINVNAETVVVRYTNDGVFLTQELYLHEVELVKVDDDEYL